MGRGRWRIGRSAATQKLLTAKVAKKKAAKYAKKINDRLGKLLGGFSFLRGRGFALFLGGFAAPHFGHPLSGVHGAAAFTGAAMAGGGIFVVVEVVVPDQLFAGSDVADGEEPNAAFDLVYFAVGITGVIQKSAESFAVNNGLAVVQSI